ncbi:MAG: CHAT domain-containing protein [Zoogloea sp.]|nr:CHAT domain-containing protein [Zoogloea sp.]
MSVPPRTAPFREIAVPTAATRLRLPAAAPSNATPATLPGALTMPGSRAANAPSDPLLPDILTPLNCWRLAGTSRSDEAPAPEAVEADGRLLALEATDGTTLFIRADELAARLGRLALTQPGLIAPDGALDLAAFRPRDSASRGLGQWLWRQVTALAVKPDDITELARARASEWLGHKVEDLAVAGASTLGAKAIVSVIEDKLAGPPGLYPWSGGSLVATDRLTSGDPRLAGLAGRPALIFIHGTGSHTLGGFGALPGSKAWADLRRQFGEHIYGFEHRTFSESPVDNALQLLAVLPKGARLHLVTHSRGGLVGDLLCLDTGPGSSRQLDDLIAAFRRRPRAEEAAREQADPALTTQREAWAVEERKKLGKLVGLLRTRDIRVERYVRVGCPSRGTLLLTDNLDIFLSGLFALVRKFGSLGAHAAGSATGIPGAGAAATAVTEKNLRFLSRVLIEVADKRLQAHALPGIEAMLPDSPLGSLLGRAATQAGLKMGVIAGDIEGGGLLKRLGTLFTDTRFFDRGDNDLVVDTPSMYGGIAWQAGARALFIQGENVNHFRYFRDDTPAPSGQPLPRAMQAWLSADEPAQLPDWENPAIAEPEPVPDAPRRGAGPAPLLLLLPGIMGSRLEADGDRIWLAPLRLARGDLKRIGMNSTARVSAGGLVDLAYGNLGRYLQRSHHVVECPYDWRQPLANLGEQFAASLDRALDDNPGVPVRILAHSMGGLVVRAAIAARPGLWDKFVAHDGNRLVMLGTPNKGSHLFVETLLGQSDTIRSLARLDLEHPLQDILDIVAAFPGALQLLPAPGFVDADGRPPRDFYQRATWDALAAINDDFWFGKALCGRPSQGRLDEARSTWEAIADTRWVGKAPERIAYVFGQADNTPCGVLEQSRNGKPAGFVMRGTAQGDGSVTWAAGDLPGLPAERKWLMPADHMGLTSTRRYFEDIDALLVNGSPRSLSRLPASRGDAAAEIRSYRAGPPDGYLSEPEATARILGGRLRPAIRRPRSSEIRVSVRAMDLRFLQQPVLCGHYRGDPIAAAEGVIDRHLVNGALSHRQRLGIHSGELGNATIVLMPRNREERRRHSGCGAVVVGLGEMGSIDADGVTQAVRAGVLRYLLHAADRYGEECLDEPAPPADAARADTPLRLRLASLLIGTNSAARLDVADAARAVTLGVLQANREFDQGAESRNAQRAIVAELEFVELYRDTAIAAARAVQALGGRLEADLKRLGYTLKPANVLACGEGVRQRLDSAPFTDYWPRLVACDADAETTACGPESVTPRVQIPIPRDALRRILSLYGHADEVRNGQLPIPTGLDVPPTTHYAERIKFIYMGERARAESIVQQRQPGLVETFTRSALNGPNSTAYTRELGFGNTLFQLLVPPEFKAAARKTSNLILVVDEATANLPWEMLEADGRPLVDKTRVIRQFMTQRFRREVVRTDSLSACIIANPDTEGFNAQFGGPGWQARRGPDGQPERDSLADLPGSTLEGEAIRGILEGAGYQIAYAPPDSRAADVFTRLFAQPCRVLVISAHGIFGRKAADGSYRSGVVLSEGLLLSAAEIGLMETVPDLVFLNCCHLGKIGPELGDGSNRLAYSLARELIEMGVRCVVAAGWEVRDDAGQTFAETFFEQMAIAGSNFGNATHVARRVTRERHPDCNTWGAYQAYGDPAFALRTQPPEARDDQPLLAPEELIDWLEQRCLALQLPDGQARRGEIGFKALKAQVDKRLGKVQAEWAELPEVRQAIGKLYAEFGPDGFEAAHEALLQAVAGSPGQGQVAIQAIELLANIEARQAERLARQGRPGALQMADDAVARIEALVRLSAVSPTAARPVAPAGSPPNLERQSILGSAYKRKAIVQLLDRQAWRDIQPTLALARDAYARGAGEPDSPGWDPYGLINRLQLDALLGDVAAVDPQLIASCQAAARLRFGQTWDFFDAVKPVDASLALWLADTGSLGPTPGAELKRLYQDAAHQLYRSTLEFDSVVTQLGLLADFLRCRDADDPRCAVLDALAVELGGAPAAGPPARQAKPQRKGARKPGQAG